MHYVSIWCALPLPSQFVGDNITSVMDKDLAYHSMSNCGCVSVVTEFVSLFLVVPFYASCASVISEYTTSHKFVHG